MNDILTPIEAGLYLNVHLRTIYRESLLVSGGTLHRVQFKLAWRIEDLHHERQWVQPKATHFSERR